MLSAPNTWPSQGVQICRFLLRRSRSRRFLSHYVSSARSSPVPAHTLRLNSQMCFVRSGNISHGAGGCWGQSSYRSASIFGSLMDLFPFSIGARLLPDTSPLSHHKGGRRSSSLSRANGFKYDTFLAARLSDLLSRRPRAGFFYTDKMFARTEGGSNHSFFF